jgi:hypothetical protein
MSTIKNSLKILIMQVERFGAFAVDIKDLVGDEHWEDLIKALNEGRDALAEANNNTNELLLSLKEAIDLIEKNVPRDALGVDHMGDFSVPGGVMTWGVLDERLHYMREAIRKAGV